MRLQWCTVLAYLKSSGNFKNRCERFTERKEKKKKDSCYAQFLCHCKNCTLCPRQATIIIKGSQWTPLLPHGALSVSVQNVTLVNPMSLLPFLFIYPLLYSPLRFLFPPLRVELYVIRQNTKKYIPRAFCVFCDDFSRKQIQRISTNIQTVVNTVLQKQRQEL